MSDTSLLTTPRLEGAVTLDDGRRLGFAEFGAPRGRPAFWLLIRHFTGSVAGADAHSPSGPAETGTLPPFTTLRLPLETFHGSDAREESNARVR